MTYLNIGANTGIDNKTLIESINCTFGRQSITQQPQPAVFRCSFIVGPGESIYPININDPVDYSVYDSAVNIINRRLVFSGYVTDVQVNLQWSNGQGLYQYSITAVDYLAQLNSWNTSASFVKDYEGNRIKSVLQSFYPSIDVTGIESPGAYEIAVYNSGATDALTLCQEAANSAMGTFYFQHNANRLKYVSYTTRQAYTPIVLTTSDILAGDFGLTASSNDVCNSVTLTYGTGSSGTTYSDATSIAAYGTRAGTRSTTLHNVADANSQAQIILATRKDPNYNLTSITVNTATISDALRTELNQVEVGTAIEVNGLPTSEVGSFTGYVEAYSWSAARGQDILQMTLSSKEQQYAFTLWNQLNNTDTWNTYALSTTTWNDIG